MCFKFLEFEIQNLEFWNVIDVRLVNTKVIVVNPMYKFAVDIKDLF
jgi:hypothetical protein